MRGMGWTPGQGLGRFNQGIKNPIIAQANNRSQGLKCADEYYGTGSTLNIKWVKPGPDQAKNLQLPEIQVTYNGFKIKVLLDTGSDITCISEELFTDIIKPSEPPMLPLRAVIIQGAFGPKTKKITKQVLLNITLANNTIEISCLIVPALVRPFIIGSDWLQSNGCTLDFTNYKLLVPNFDNGVQIEVPFLKVPHMSPDRTLQTEETEIYMINADPSKGGLVQEKIRSCILGNREKNKLESMLREYGHVFSERPGLTNRYKHEIKMIDATPFFKKSYPVPFALRELVEEKLEEMVEMGVIERTSSPFSNPITVVKKKDGSIRICLDARTLNEKMVSDHEGPQPINEILQQFHGQKYLTSIDLVSSFWQIPLTEESKKFTTFYYNGKAYCFKVLPFGLKTSIASFSRCMDMVLGPELRQFTHNYVDDLLIASPTLEEHLRNIRSVLDRLKAANMTVNLKKSSFIRQEVQFLGHILTPDGIKPDPEKVEAINNFPRPTKLKQLRAFLGLCNYYRKYCKGYSDYTRKLGHLLKKGTDWRWGASEEQSFNQIKEQFLTEVLLIHPDPARPYILETDSSHYGVGAVLYQELDNGDKGVVGFQSRSFQAAELNYMTTEKELCAIIYALTKFRLYLLYNKFIIRTDHKALTFLKQCRFLNERINRWVLFLQQFDFSIEHIKGKDNTVADILSRYPHDTKNKNNIGQNTDAIIATFKVEGSTALLRDFKNLPREQNKDPILRQIGEALRTNKRPVDKEIDRMLESYHSYNGVLLFEEPSTKAKRIAVPKHLQTRLIWQYHQEMGHFASKKIYTVLKNTFYWPRMKKQIFKELRGCDLCQKSKKPNISIRGPLQPIITNDVGDLVAVDFYGPLPRSRGGVCYILVAVDVFSKFVKLFPLKRATAYAAAKRILTELTPIIKIKKILSDHGTQFTSEKWRKPLQEFGIQVTYASIRNAPSNPSERYMKELGRFFRTYCHKKHTSWAMFIDDIEECVNKVPHSSTGKSPEEILTGKTPDFQLSKVVSNFLPRQSTTNIEEIKRDVREVLFKEAQRRQKSQKGHITKFQVNDLVLLKLNPTSNALEGLARKFHLLYGGPYQIANIPRVNVYQLVEPETGNIKGNYNARNLILYHMRNAEPKATDVTMPGV